MVSKELTNAAKAIYESRNGAGCRPWSQLPAIAKAAYLDDAEAARKSFFAALQEPTDEMLGAGQKAWLADPLKKSSTLWRAMLSASPLGEQSE